MKRIFTKGLSRLGLVLSLSFLPLLGQAQSDSLKNASFTPGMGLGVGGGLKGISAQLSYYFHPHWNLRGEINGLRIEDLSVEVNFSGQVLSAVGNLDLLNGALILDYFPAPERSSFHLFAGLSHAFRQRMQGRGFYA